MMYKSNPEDGEPQLKISAEKIDADLPPDLGPYDVLCGRHKAALNNIGNRRLRVTVSMYLDRFMTARDRKEKSLVISTVLSVVEQSGGRFLAWSAAEKAHVPIHRKRAYDKCSHLFRDMALAAARNTRRPSQGHNTLLSSYFSSAQSTEAQELPVASSEIQNMELASPKGTDTATPMDLTTTDAAPSMSMGESVPQIHQSDLSRSFASASDKNEGGLELPSHKESKAASDPTPGIPVAGDMEFTFDDDISSFSGQGDTEQGMLLDLLRDIEFGSNPNNPKQG